MLRAIDAANFLVDYSVKTGDELTNLRLNKLLYFAQGQSLARDGNVLFPDTLEAWRLGPVVRSVYHKYSACGSCAITDVDDSFSFDSLQPEDVETLMDIYHSYGKYSTSYLVDRTHRSGSPWAKAYQQGENTPVSVSEMADYFRANEKMGSAIDSYLFTAPEIKGARNADGLLILPKEEDDDWEL